MTKRRPCLCVASVRPAATVPGGVADRDGEPWRLRHVTVLGVTANARRPCLLEGSVGFGRAVATPQGLFQGPGAVLGFCQPGSELLGPLLHGRQPGRLAALLHELK